MNKVSYITIGLLIYFLSVNYSDSQIWTKVPGTSSYINTIFFPKSDRSKMVVGSDQIPTDLGAPELDFPHYGVGQNGFQFSTDSAKTFGDPILKDYSIYSIHQNPSIPNIWFASVRKLTDGSIAVSTDNGNTWDENNLRCIETSQIMSFGSVAGTPNIYFTASLLTNKGLKLSSDDFNSCLTFDQLDIQARDLRISPINSNIIFIGGDNSIGHVIHTTDGGKTWIPDSKGLEGLRVLTLLPSSINTGIVYCGADSINQMTKQTIGKGIFQSLDTGKTWKQIAANNSTVYDLQQHPLYPRYIVAACGNEGVYMSGTYGWGWEHFSAGIPDTGSVRKVGLPAWDSTSDGIVVFAAVFGDGLYRSKRIKTDINDDNSLSSREFPVQIIPNPSNRKFYVQWTPVSEKINHIKIVDLFGRVIYSTEFSQSVKENLFEIDLTGYNLSGSYFLLINNGYNYSATKLILTK